MLAAGMGTRMKSNTIKVLHKLLGKPMISYPLGVCRDSGIGKIVVVVGHQAEEVRAAAVAPDVDFAVQAEQNGTGRAVLCAKEALGETSGTALILCGDVPLLTASTVMKLLTAHCGAGALVTVLSMYPEDPKGYGRLVKDSQGKLCEIVEERDADDSQRAIGEVNSGTYAVELPWLWDALDKIGSDNSQGEYYLTDIVKIAAEEGSAASFCLEDPEEAMGVNSRAHLAEAEAALRKRINEFWMDNGVTLDRPQSITVAPDVELARDVQIGFGCALLGSTRVGESAIIGQGAIITNSVVGARAEVQPYSILTDAMVEPTPPRLSLSRSSGKTMRPSVP